VIEWILFMDDDVAGLQATVWPKAGAGYVFGSAGKGCDWSK
jgi:hypothetical protein